MTTITANASKRVYALTLLGAIGFVAAGAFLISTGDAKNVRAGWISVVFFGAGIPLFAWQLFNSKPRLILDDQGAYDKTLGVGVIPWHEITGAQLKAAIGGYFVCLELRNPNHWLEKLPLLKRKMVSANAALGFADFNLNLVGTDADPARVHEFVLQKIAANQGR